jgi:hypothetical protein
MALELFKPFIFERLEKMGIASTIKAAKKEVEAETPVVWGHSGRRLFVSIPSCLIALRLCTVLGFKLLSLC